MEEQDGRAVAHDLAAACLEGGVRATSDTSRARCPSAPTSGIGRGAPLSKGSIALYSARYTLSRER